MKSIIFAFVVLLFLGCANKNLEYFNQQYYQGHVETAYTFAKKMILESQQNSTGQEQKKSKKGHDDLMWQVQGGIAGFFIHAKDTKDLLLSADIKMQESIKTFASKFFGNVAAILTSDQVLPYPIYLYEASMVNYYLALDALSQGKNSDARVYLNQAIERQNDAKSYYAREIETNRKEFDKMKRVDANASVDAQYLAATIDFAKNTQKQISQVNEKYINPMIFYLKFLFELQQHKYSIIASMPKDLIRLIPKQDLDILESRKKGSKKTYIWVIIEDGKSAQKETLKISIPLLINPKIFLNPALLLATVSSNDLSTTTLIAATTSSVMLNYAEPRLVSGENFSQNYRIDEQKIDKFFDMQDLIQTEFLKRMPSIRTRAILRSIPPAITAFIAEETGRETIGYSGIGFLASLLHRAIISADTRMITALPNSFFVTRIENTSGIRKLFVDEKKMLQFSIENQDKDVIVYVRNLGNNLFVRILD